MLSRPDALDSTIRLFDLGVDLEDMPERSIRPTNVAFRSEAQRFLLHTFMVGGELITTYDLARRVMNSRWLNEGAQVLAKLIATRTGRALKRLR